MVICTVARYISMFMDELRRQITEMNKRKCG
ncbi:hypothetical protein N825_27020 [Skermanella stibiiresistens SB22]|uniref:Uncharacterized protein n=1 Tax=Skermanella stibiiresistens SB22 TaxID=1385369 RepID=W9GR67_9PROT|nr:hypothetical protein N825_27020 [Skermanella stibiiresistens SB22]